MRNEPAELKRPNVLGQDRVISYTYRVPENEQDLIDLCGSMERVYDIVGGRNGSRMSAKFTPAVIAKITDEETWNKHVAEAQNSLATGDLKATKGEGNTAMAALGSAVSEAVKSLDPNASAEEKLAALRAAGIKI